MNSALRKPALLTIIIILAVVTASGLLIRSNTSSGKTPQSSDAHEQVAKAAEAPVTGETPKADEFARVGETPKVSNPAEARETPKAQALGSPKSIEEHRQLLETVGILTAAHSYQTHLNIGFIADGKAKGTYTDKEAYKLLDSVLSLLDSVDRKLAVLGKIELDKEDHESLEQMRDLSELLHRQGKRLEIFWDSGKDEDAAQYESVRKDSWAAISRLIGIGR